MSTLPPASCPACDQPAIPARLCACGHGEAEHDLNTRNDRTACFHIHGPRGKRCECKRFTEAAALARVPAAEGERR